MKKPQTLTNRRFLVYQIDSRKMKNILIKKLIQLKNKNTGFITEALRKHILMNKIATHSKVPKKFTTKLIVNPWRYIKDKKILTETIVTLRTKAKKKTIFNTAKWARYYHHRIRIKGRFMLKQLHLVEKNPQLLSVAMQRYRVYQRLFAYGYLARLSKTFFMKNNANNSFYKNNTMGLKHSLVFADIVVFKLWTLRRFLMRPIFMNRMFCLALGSIKKSQIRKSLIYAKRVKLKKVSRFFLLFQYSLFSLIYQSFKTMGLPLLLHYIKSGFFFVNGEIITNPLHPCKTTDVVQFNVFYLFKSIEAFDFSLQEYIAAGKQFMRSKESVYFFLLSFFKSTILLRPKYERSIRFRKNKLMPWLRMLLSKRSEINRWYFQIIPKLIHFDLKEQSKSSTLSLNNLKVDVTENFIGACKTTNFLTIIANNLQIRKYLAYKLEIKPETKPTNITTKIASLTDAQKKTKSRYAKTIFSILQKMKAQRTNTIDFLRYRYMCYRNLATNSSAFRIKRAMKSLGKFWFTNKAAQRHHKYLKYRWLIQPTSNPKRKLKYNIKNSITHMIRQKRTSVINVSRSIVTSKSSDAVMRQKHQTYNQAMNLIVDTDVFAFTVINNTMLNIGRRSFLNKACARFILSFCCHII